MVGRGGLGHGGTRTVETVQWPEEWRKDKKSMGTSDGERGREKGRKSER